jgi:hypothetical protein
MDRVERLSPEIQRCPFGLLCLSSLAMVTLFLLVLVLVG